jgi:hypothetical protein
VLTTSRAQSKALNIHDIRFGVNKGNKITTIFAIIYLMLHYIIEIIPKFNKLREDYIRKVIDDAMSFVKFGLKNYPCPIKDDLCNWNDVLC